MRSISKRFLPRLTILASLALGMSSQSFAIGSYVDFHTESRSCPASWTWHESISVPGKMVPNTKCAMKDAIVVVNEEPIKTFDAPAEKVYVDTYNLHVVSTTGEYAFNIAQRQAVARFKNSDLFRQFRVHPKIMNKEFLSPSYLYYDFLTKSMEVMPEHILEPTAESLGGACVNCQEGNFKFAVYFNYKPIRYTIPTRPGKVKVDENCPDTVWEEGVGSRYEIGRSLPLATLSEVSDPAYQSIDGNSLPGASHDMIWCPNGMSSFSKPSAEVQAATALSWLDEKGSSLDIGNSDVQAMIKYLVSLALEKTVELSNSQLKRILDFHKSYPHLAFPGEETEANAVETSATDIALARAQWTLIEKRLIALPNTSDKVALSDLNNRVGNSEIILFHQDPMVDARLSYSAFRKALSYIVTDNEKEVLTFFREDGSILVSSRSGETLYKPNSPERAELVKKITGEVIGYKSGPQAAADAAVLQTLELFHKYLNPPVPEEVLSPEEKAVAEARRALKEAIGFEPSIRVNLDHYGLTLALGKGEADFAVTHWVYRAPSTDIEYSRSSIKYDRATDHQNYLAKTTEYYQFLNDEIAYVNSAMEAAASKDPARVPILTIYKSYLLALSAVK